MFCILLVNHLGEAQKLRKRMIADARLRARGVYVKSSVSSAAVVPVADEAGEGIAATPYRVQEQTPHDEAGNIHEVAADPPTDTPQYDTSTNTSNKGDLHDEGHVEQLKTFMDAKRGVLWSQVTVTFFTVITAEIVLSMVLYQQTGTPTAWCAPFSFGDLNRGFQVVLDFFL